VCTRFLTVGVYTAILQTLWREAKSSNPTILRWIPAHRGILGNEKADKLAKDMTNIGRIPPRNQKAEKKVVIKKLDNLAVHRFQKSYTRTQWGQFTWKLDGALPGAHTRLLYKSLNTDQARILVQARTGQNHLNAFRARLKAIESPICECGKGKEDIQHLLVRCEVWKGERRLLREVAGERYSDISFLLGGWSARRVWYTGQPIDGERAKWKPNLQVVKAAVEFMQKTGRMENTERGDEEGEGS